MARHSGATAATVHARLHVDTAGAGGTRRRRAAAPTWPRGTGLAGLADRVAAVGGRLLLSSPPGGPTLIRVELPCSG